MRDPTSTTSRTRPRRPRGVAAPNAGVQLGLFRRRDLRGGARDGAGRKPKGLDAGVPHRPRQAVSRHHGIHVTQRVAPDVVSSLRGPAATRVLAGVFQAANTRTGFRLTQFSVQTDHLHFVVEADNRRALASGLQSITIRLAKGLNRITGRRGRVFPDRYHASVVRSPRHARSVLLYVLQNARHHGKSQAPKPGTPWQDPHSSARWFGGWKGPPLLPVPRPDEPPPVAPARSWLFTQGWRRHGLLDPREGPE